MDEDADRKPEPQSDITERKQLRSRLNQEFREMQEESDDGWGIADDPLNNPANYVDVPLWEAIDSNAYKIRQFDYSEKDGVPYSTHLAHVIGDTRLRPFYWDTGDADVLRNLNGEEAARVYLYYDLSPLPAYRIGDRLDDEPVRDALGISSNVSWSSIRRMPSRMDDGYRSFLASESETLVRQWQGRPYEEWVRQPTPDTVAPDGEGVPPEQRIARELRSETFKYIRLKRDESISVTKDAALRALVAAGNGNAFVNNAAENLIYKDWYDGSDIMTGEALNYNIRKSNLEEITRMFQQANAPLFEIAADHGYFPDNAEVAIDITDWPFYGDSGADEYIRGTKPGRNYARAWKYITLSLVGTSTPFILFVLPVRKRQQAPAYVRRLLRVASQYVNINRVYMDSGTEFYNSDTISTVSEFGLDLVMQGRKSGEEIKRFFNGLSRINRDSSYLPYGVGSLDKDDYYAVGIKSEKKSALRKSEPDEPADDYTYFYTNLDPTKVPPEEIGRFYRRRWGIETGFRVVKEEFLAKSGSRGPNVRSFYFNFAAHLYNLWTVANIRRAEEVNGDLSQGNLIKAGSFMQAIEDDPYDLDIPTELPETEYVLGELF